MSGVTVTEVRDGAGFRRFLRVPYEVHRTDPRWVPPVVAEERDRLLPERNPSFRHAEATLALAWRDGAPAGRIAGIADSRRADGAARFGWLECRDEPEVAAALLAHVEGWARARGLDRLVGPMGFTDQDPEGFQVEGFDHEPTIGTYANLPYLPGLLAACGYVKEVDYVVYGFSLRHGIPESYRRIAARALARSGCRLVEPRSRRELTPFLIPILELMDATFAGLYGYAPLDDDEREDLARRFRPLLDPRFVKLITKGGRLAGFLVAMPNVDPGLRRARGRLFPFGLLHLLLAARRSRQLDLLVGAARPDIRGHGLDVAALTALLRTAIAAGFESVDSHLELEGNHLVRAEMERLGGTVTKRYRVFRKELRSCRSLRQ